MKDVSIFWFRRDLRIDDNIGLFNALKENECVLPLFIFDKTILSKLEDSDDKRVSFIYENLRLIKEKLQTLGTDLIVEYGNIEDVWKEILSKYKVKNVYANEDYEPSAIARDNKVDKLLTSHKISLSFFKDQCVFAKKEILKKDGLPYTVYTAYKNKWYETLTPNDIASVDCKKYYKNFVKIKKSSMPSLESMGFSLNMPELGRTIKKSIVETYNEFRDIPSLGATTHISTHLRFGTISVRKCAQVGMSINKDWLNQIIWRDFFMQILFHFPHVAKRSFRQKYDSITWLKNKKDLEKWQQGLTGYPLVDAGMRELNATGDMHNRVRMVTASFLVKHLLIDWREGEKYFARKLLDFDLALNNGNWQWVAGTGCDAAPYFRVFNPMTQLKRFDKDFEYVKKWVPEYGTEKYPEPMVDHKFAYDRVLLAYGRVK